MTKAAKARTSGTKLTTAKTDPIDAPRELRIGRELADTTWRMTVPVVLFAGLGIAADKTLGSQPWLTLVGLITGFGIAAWLILRQLRRWPTLPVKPGSYERNRRPGDKQDDEEKDYYND